MTFKVLNTAHQLKLTTTSTVMTMTPMTMMMMTTMTMMKRKWKRKSPVRFWSLNKNSSRLSGAFDYKMLCTEYKLNLLRLWYFLYSPTLLHQGLLLVSQSISVMIKLKLTLVKLEGSRATVVH